MMAVLTVPQNEILQHFAWWCGALTAKILFLAPLIGYYRWTRYIWISPEDTKTFMRGQVRNNDPDIERVRRAFLNDLENIFPWFLSTSIYLTTSPPPILAINLIRTFGIARFIHTFVYAIFVIPQPARFLSYLTGYCVIAYQAYKILRYYA